RPMSSAAATWRRRGRREATRSRPLRGGVVTPDLSPLDPETERLLREVSSATLATVLFVHGLKNQVLLGVRRLRPGGPRMVGVARTLRYIAARDDLETLELWKRDDNPQRRIADEIEPGQVLVIDARGEQRSGTMGGMLVARMQARGAAGIVSDGPFRDGLAGLAITCGGVQVRPGDVVYGDD